MPLRADPSGCHQAAIDAITRAQSDACRLPPACQPRDPQARPCDARAACLGLTPSTLCALGRVHLARVTVLTLQLAKTADAPPPDDAAAAAAKKGKADKPPKPEKGKKGKKGGKDKSSTFFIEYKLPIVAEKLGLATTSNRHEETRVASQNVDKKTGLVRFDQHAVFPVRFSAQLISRWQHESVEFVVQEKKHGADEPTAFGRGSFQLKRVFQEEDFKLQDSVCIKLDQHDSNHDLNDPACHCAMQICVELAGDSKDLPAQMSPVKKPESVDVPTAYTVTRMVPAGCPDLDYAERAEQRHQAQFQTKEVACKAYSKVAACEQDFAVCDDGSRDEVIGMCPRIASRILFFYLMIKEGRNIPGTRKCAAVCLPPNVFLVCRMFASCDVGKTPVVWDTSNPKFNYTQLVPVQIDGQLFKRMRNNFVVVEVWTKLPNANQTCPDKLIGLAKVPLNMFYQSLKDAEIARSVMTSHYPLVAVDGFVPIVDVFSGNERGKLQCLLALGTQSQIDALRKAKEFDQCSPGRGGGGAATTRCRKDSDDRHGLDATDESDGAGAIDGADDEGRAGLAQQHVFEITVNGIRGFRPHDSQVWGETDCFVQYHFPAIKPPPVCEAGNLDGRDLQEAVDVSYCDAGGTIVLRAYRTDTTLCVPDPLFQHRRRLQFQPPAGTPIQRVLMGACAGVGKHPGGGVPFEVWSRFYYPNVRDQLLAKGSLPAAKLCALVTMRTCKTSEQTYFVPLQFVDPEICAKAAGQLSVTVKYIALGCDRPPCEQPVPCDREVTLQINVERASGLRTACEAAARRRPNDSDLAHASAVGCNAYAVAVPCFLSPGNCQERRETKCVARSFTPAFRHSIDVSCPLLRRTERCSTLSLAEMLAVGFIELEIWHRPTPPTCHNMQQMTEDVLLGKCKLDTSVLLTRTTGYSGWLTLQTREAEQGADAPRVVDVGAVDVHVRFARAQDLADALRTGARHARPPWTPRHDLARLLAPDPADGYRPLDHVATPCAGGHVTACVTVTCAWVPARMTCGADERTPAVYARYKFYDHDSVVTSVCALSSRCEGAPHAARLSHRRSFLCKAAPPLIYNLREEALDVELWLTRCCRLSRDRRPLSADRLIGVARVDLSPLLVGGLHRQQHVSGVFVLRDADNDRYAADACARVYVSTTPGDCTRPCDFPCPDDPCDAGGVVDDDAPRSPRRSRPCDASFDSSDASGCEGDDFAAVVLVERAMHLPYCDPSIDAADDDDGGDVATCYVTYPTVDCERTATRAVPMTSTCPVLNDSREVRLSRKLLGADCGRLLFRVWRGAGATVRGADSMLGFATVDLSILSAGFRAVNGWYNVLDLHGICQGQLKVAVTPTAPIRPGACRRAASAPRHRPPPVHQSASVMRKVPFETPVQTPSGSVYYPGVPVREHQQQQEDGGMVIPSRSRFTADTGKQQECLLDTLQRQIRELEVIRRNFEGKRRACAWPAPGPSCAPARTRPVSPTPEPNAKPEATSSSSPPPHATSTPFASARPEERRPASVHLSLIEADRSGAGRDDDDDPGTMSDADLSDVELVRPRNLHPYDDDDDGDGDDDVILLPDDAKEAPSNATSLWLSTSQHDQSPPSSGEVSAPSAGEAVTVAPPAVVDDDDVIRETIDDVAKAAADRAARDDVMVIEGEDDRRVEAEAVRDDCADDAATSCADDAVTSSSTEHETVVSRDDVVERGETTEDDVDASEREDATASKGGDTEGDGDVTNEGGDVTSEERESRAAADDCHGEDELTGDQTSGGDVQDATDESDDDESSSATPDSSSPAHHLLPQPDPPAQEHHHHLPSFFPPSRDLARTMRALQVATDKQQHQLGRGGSRSDDDDHVTTRNDDRATASDVQAERRRRRQFARAECDASRTDRLQRIFSTKFGNVG